MANKNDSWQFTDAWDDTLTVQVDGDKDLRITAQAAQGVIVPNEKVRELRDWLTAKLEAENE